MNTPANPPPPKWDPQLIIEMVREWGPLCEEYEPLCPCCQAWRLFKVEHKPPTIAAVVIATVARQH